MKNKKAKEVQLSMFKEEKATPDISDVKKEVQTPLLFTEEYREPLHEVRVLLQDGSSHAIREQFNYLEEVEKFMQEKKTLSCKDGWTVRVESVMGWMLM